jgi:two-component system, NtrC family, sensor kinase
MQRRGESEQPVKGRRNRAIRPKTSKSSTAPLANATTQEQLDQRTRERDESREQQTATAEILKVLSSSTFDLQTVFDTIVVNAVRLCHAHMGAVHRFDGRLIHIVAHHNFPPDAVEVLQRMYPRPPQPDQASGRAILTREVAEIEDMLADQQYTREVTVAGRWGSILAVPMLRDGAPIGAIVITRNEVGRFADRHIDLLKTFADQAVIAIENARLFNETKEALEQQTATSEVLRVISRSPSDIQPVLDSILQTAGRLCESEYACFFRLQDGKYHLAGSNNAKADYIKYLSEHPISIDRGTVVGRAAVERRTVHIPDCLADPEYTAHENARIGKHRSLLGVPLLRDGIPVAVIGLLRTSVKPYTDKQVELVETFADQAVIAIENTRLLSELRESLQQQTTTADVLKVISRSTFDLETVLDTLTASAARLCQADKATIFEKDGDVYRLAAHFGLSPEEEKQAKQYAREHPLGPGSGSVVGRVAMDGRAVHIRDVLADAEYQASVYQKAFGFRSNLGVPLLREGAVIGVFALMRMEVNPFTEKEIELVSTFADQAVIATENTRLLSELRESLQQQTATADVLKVISRSTFDLQTVLDTLVKSAASLCEADQSFLYRRDGEKYVWAASHGYSPEFVKLRKSQPLVPDRGTGVGRAIVESKIVHIPDVLEDKEYSAWDLQQVAGYRAVLGVPLLREGVSMGVFSLARREPRSFTDKQIELLTMFADQAAIAMENVRLFESVETRTRELAKSLEDLRTTQDRLVQTQKLASLGQLTAGIAHEIKNPLNFVNNFSAVSVELIDELRQALSGAHLDSKLRAEISEIADTLQGNLDKVVQHGKRADAIVKNMLLHSREGSGEHRLVDINSLVEESLNLAYHGARAEKQGFNITMERSLDPAAGQADVFPQDVTRVLLNLISNGFYAATKRKAQADGDGYEPTLVASTRTLGDRVEIKIRDNGTGIPPEVKEKIFNPFFTTKPAGEGTGLGLSICHDIIVKQHGGSIEVDTKPGEFTEIKVTLPRVAALLS